MITCRLKGGIGNLMFQIATMEYLSKKSGIKNIYYNINQYLTFLNTEQKHNPGMKHALEYKKIFKNFVWQDTKLPKGIRTIKLPFEYTQITPKDNMLYDGFFQSEKFFPDKNFVYNLFEPSDFVKKQLKKYEYLKDLKTCSIHIRRGDYLKFSSHPVQTLEYYKAAQHHIGEVDKYLIFSDDIPWCKNVFKGDKYIFIENEKDYVELFLQAQCDHNIIANSSFSWWGAYLNKNPNKKVIAPSKWFSSKKYNDKDIIPKEWIKI